MHPAVSMIPRDQKTLLILGGIAVAGVVFAPQLLKWLGEQAGNAAGGAVTGVAKGAGTAAGAVIMAAPTAINAAIEKATGKKDALQAGGGWLGRTFYDLTHRKADSCATSTVYVPTFPDGSRHAVDSCKMDALKRFVYNGVRYQLRTVGGKPVAVKV